MSYHEQEQPFIFTISISQTPKLNKKLCADGWKILYSCIFNKKKKENIKNDHLNI